MYSWWRVGLSPETCRVKHLRRINRNCCISLELFHYTEQMFVVSFMIQRVYSREIDTKYLNSLWLADCSFVRILIFIRLHYVSLLHGKKNPLLAWSAVPGAYGRDAFFRYAVRNSCYRRTMVIIRAENCYQYLYAYLRRFHCLTQSFTNNKNEYTRHKVTWNSFLEYVKTWILCFEMEA